VLLDSIRRSQDWRIARTHVRAIPSRAMALATCDSRRAGYERRRHGSPGIGPASCWRSSIPHSARHTSSGVLGARGSGHVAAYPLSALTGGAGVPAGERSRGVVPQHLRRSGDAGEAFLAAGDGAPSVGGRRPRCRRPERAHRAAQSNSCLVRRGRSEVNPACLVFVDASRSRGPRRWRWRPGPRWRSVRRGRLRAPRRGWADRAARSSYHGR
jgi:hypothetical protein